MVTFAITPEVIVNGAAENLLTLKYVCVWRDGGGPIKKQ